MALDNDYALQLFYHLTNIAVLYTGVFHKSTDIPYNGFIFTFCSAIATAAIVFCVSWKYLVKHHGMLPM